MKRFVDVRHAHIGHAFAWFDTITDTFETHGGEQAWDTWDDFTKSFNGSSDDLARYLALTPEWALMALASKEKD